MSHLISCLGKLQVYNNKKSSSLLLIQHLCWSRINQKIYIYRASLSLALLNHFPSIYHRHCHVMHLQANVKKRFKLFIIRKPNQLPSVVFFFVGCSMIMMEIRCEIIKMLTCELYELASHQPPFKRIIRQRRTDRSTNQHHWIHYCSLSTRIRAGATATHQRRVMHFDYEDY